VGQRTSKDPSLAKRKRFVAKINLISTRMGIVFDAMHIA
jgi:hypothetical protein